jgi:hypothetical protein
MNAEWLPLLATALGIFGAAGTYAYQKRVDRRNQLMDMRRAAYRDFLNVLADLGETSNAPHVATKYRMSRVDLFVIASDEVIKTMFEFINSFPADKTDSFHVDEHARAIKFADMVRAMRADGYESTSLSTDELVKLSPMKFRRAQTGVE